MILKYVFLLGQIFLEWPLLIYIVAQVKLSIQLVVSFFLSTLWCQLQKHPLKLFRKKMFLKILRYSQEDIFDGISF